MSQDEPSMPLIVMLRQMYHMEPCQILSRRAPTVVGQPQRQPPCYDHQVSAPRTHRGSHVSSDHQIEAGERSRVPGESLLMSRLAKPRWRGNQVRLTAAGTIA